MTDLLATSRRSSNNHFHLARTAGDLPTSTPIIRLVGTTPDCIADAPATTSTAQKKRMVMLGIRRPIGRTPIPLSHHHPRRRPSVPPPPPPPELGSTPRKRSSGRGRAWPDPCGGQRRRGECCGRAPPAKVTRRSVAPSTTGQPSSSPPCYRCWRLCCS
ncbi:hypothetical protein PVAP13_5KG360300 [Panicum virgatum]|uniref:Uncharacterized protein n=1 Tax=Panicum virgatum TaxID=38727 RepID=A0A8T0SJF3_PANVG|nr:hypothetical protein PVAP13_5KG360300 [Panicum virgatum]